MFEYKVFVRDGVEYFGMRQEAHGRAKKESFALGQSLLDFLDVDMDKYIKPFAQMGEQQDGSLFEQELQKLAREHVYFQFVRLDWLDRQKKEGEAFLSSKELSRFPMRVIALQHQLRRLIAGALDYGSRKTQRIHSTLTYVKFYYEEPEPGSKFPFGPITTEFSCANGMYGDVLVARSLEDIPNYLLREFIRTNCYYKTCLHCGKYFVPDHGNAEYCIRPVADGDKTCRDIGATKNYRDKLRENPVQRVYSRAYKTRFARIKYKTMTREDFQVWSVEAREKRDAVLRGEMALEELLEWCEG